MSEQGYTTKEWWRHMAGGRTPRTRDYIMLLIPHGAFAAPSMAHSWLTTTMKMIDVQKSMALFWRMPIAREFLMRPSSEIKLELRLISAMSATKAVIYVVIGIAAIIRFVVDTMFVKHPFATALHHTPAFIYADKNINRVNKLG